MSGANPGNNDGSNKKLRMERQKALLPGISCPNFYERFDARLAEYPVKQIP
jgi:hypothetical protein